MNHNSTNYYKRKHVDDTFIDPAKCTWCSATIRWGKVQYRIRTTELSLEENHFCCRACAVAYAETFLIEGYIE